MKPKEKAKEIFDNMLSIYNEHDVRVFPTIHNNLAKKGARICVDEMIELCQRWEYHQESTGNAYLSYWQEVKQEIERL